MQAHHDDDVHDVVMAVAIFLALVVTGRVDRDAHVSAAICSTGPSSWLRRTSPAKNAAMRPSRSSTSVVGGGLRDDLAELRQQPSRLVVQRRVGDLLRAISFGVGASARQGAHHDAQKLSTTTSPRRSATASGSPSSVVPDSAGAGGRSSTGTQGRSA